jgi:hypothetical protein
MKNHIVIKHNGDTPDVVLEIGKVVVIDVDRDVLYFEKMKDGKWRLTASKSIIPDFTKLESLQIVRE